MKYDKIFKNREGIFNLSIIKSGHSHFTSMITKMERKKEIMYVSIYLHKTQHKKY